jgi:acyl-CoA reductase-like NAD-dependent aldehyde dehydrogenase
VSERLDVRKTYKLYAGGEFVRSESGRSYQAEGVNVPRASRKDLRDAVRAARSAFPGWSRRTAMNRGQVLYRIAEMLDARRAQFAALLGGGRAAGREVDAAVDVLVWYAGLTDKLAQLVGTVNPVAGPYFNFTVPEPTGVVGIIAPTEPALLGLVSRLLPALVGGNTAVVVASEAHPLAAIELAECIATADVPSGVVNIITGLRSELAPVLASHMDVAALDLSGADGDAAELERLGAENVKRIVRGKPDHQSPYEISALLELKTVWHPVGM